jgi:glucokinase
VRYIVGVDIGGTNLVTGAVAEDGSRLVGLRSTPTRPEEGPDAVLVRLAEQGRATIEELLASEPGAQVTGLGVGAPGPLDTRTGVIFLTPNLGWENLPLRQRMADLLGLPATLDNDANCAVLGEWWRGAARGTRHAVGLTIGTGIGGGIIIEGRLYHGTSDCAGEFGHTTIDPAGRRCNCGNYGCLEAYASGPAIALRTVEALAAGVESVIRNMVHGDLSQVTAQTVYQAATHGDELAREVVRDTAKYLGAGVANLINIFNPEVVVICGGVTLAGDLLLVPLRHEVARRAFRPAVQACRIVFGALTGTAGVYGAVASHLQLRSVSLSVPGGAAAGATWETRA